MGRPNAALRPPSATEQFAEARGQHHVALGTQLSLQIGAHAILLTTDHPDQRLFVQMQHQAGIFMLAETALAAAILDADKE